MKNNSQQKGISAVEVLVAMSIVIAISVSIGIFQSDIFKKSRTNQSRILASDDARLTLRRFLEETRNASPASNGAYPVLTAQKNAFTFYADTDNDGLKERFRYYLESGSLKKATLKPTGSPAVYTGTEKVFIMVHSIASTSAGIFTYYDTTDTAIAEPVTPASIRSVQLSLPVIITGPNSVGTTTVTLQSRGTLRNLKDNY
jgi:type II secretory pathway pseudopilin PulG